MALIAFGFTEADVGAMRSIGPHVCRSADEHDPDRTSADLLVAATQPPQCGHSLP